MERDKPFITENGVHGHLVNGRIFLDANNMRFGRQYTDEVADMYLQMLHEDRKVIKKPNRTPNAKRRRR